MSTAAATLVWMTIADILALASVDAEVEMDYRAEGFSHKAGLALEGTTVADILPFKRWDIEHDTSRYDAVRDSMQAHGQTAPIAVRAGYLVNGGHRLALAIELGWPGLWATDECSDSSDREYDAVNGDMIEW